MNRDDLKAQLAGLDLAGNPDEESARRRMLDLLDEKPDCFHRHCFPGHFTGSALVVSQDGARTLLHHHRKLDRWLQFGGHCDGEEDVLEVARREALEESGITGLLPVSTQPFDLDIHPIPAKGGEPAHFHYDIRFLFLAPAGTVPAISEESLELRWFSPEETESLALDRGLRRMLGKWREFEP